MERRGAKGTAAAQNRSGKIVVADVVAQIEAHDLPPLRGQDVPRLAGKGDGFLAGVLDPVGDDKLRLADISLSQELLGACAALSRLAVVVPFDIDGHVLS